MKYATRRVCLFHRNRQDGEIFTFESLKEEEIKKADGWYESKNEMLGAIEPEKAEPPVEKLPDLDKEIKEIVKEFPELKGEDGEPKPFTCDVCGFVGNSLRSLNMHKLGKHRVR